MLKVARNQWYTEAVKKLLNKSASMIKYKWPGH